MIVVSQAEDVRRLRGEQQRLEEVRARAQHQLALAKSATAALDKELHEAHERLKERDRENAQLNKVARTHASYSDH